ncbi:hypothetical protein SIM22_05870 [Bacillus cereus group sp. BfR-BA-01363]|uniref:hypothetical protein n=1 Tax=Bacillus cereus group sp. BfR-BA-01363 TaxID=3094882 RepID=UPI0029C3C512|nr:hypothetical protein [Bacillus cereus group sp. BfR-BA-01363]MDX5853630.1 hypothetical protein [Bacillus cereus group sp. BfR-BA-01363]
MSKTVLLLVNGGEYASCRFEEDYNPQEFYEQMVDIGITKKEYLHEEGTTIVVSIHEFPYISPLFIELVKKELMDYEHAKDVNIYEVKGIDMEQEINVTEVRGTEVSGLIKEMGLGNKTATRE